MTPWRRRPAARRRRRPAARSEVSTSKPERAAAGRGAVAGPSASSASTWLAQPGPSCQVSVTRSVIAAGLAPAEPSDLVQVIAERLGQHRAERLVGAGQPGDRCRQGGPVGLGGAVDGAEPELAAEVDEQLVAARGHAVAQRLDRVGGADLVEAHLGPQATRMRGRRRRRRTSGRRDARPRRRPSGRRRPAAWPRRAALGRGRPRPRLARPTPRSSSTTGRRRWRTRRRRRATEFTIRGATPVYGRAA